MPNNFEPINPDKVVIDNEIDPAKVVIDNDRTGYRMIEADKKRVREAFTGDPLGFIADTDVRSYVSSTTENFPDRDEYRKRMALAAYFTAFGGNGNFKFILSNLDGILEEFFKRKISVDSAYADISQMIAPKKERFGEKATPAESTWTAHGAALLSGMTDVSAHLAATFLKFAKWDVDFRINSLAPLLPESAVNFLKSYSSDLLESYGQKVYKSGKGISEDLSRVSGANPDFLLNMVQGDFDKVSVTDFTKALVQSAPNMGIQILVAAAAPYYALPAFVGAEQVAMKDYEVNEKQPDWHGVKKWTYIGLSAANEALFELVTSKIVGGKLSKKDGAKILQRGMMKFLGLSAAKEGSSEAAQQLLANANDLVFDIEGDSGKLSTQELFKRMFSGVLESGFVGAIYGLPEGIAGFRNSREFAGVYSEVRNKHERRVEELSAKENLSDIEKKQLEVSRTILDSADPREAVAIEYINNKIEEISGDEEIRNGFDYAGIERTAADSAEDGDIISAVKAERRNNLRNTSSWSYDDVVDKVSEYSQGFKDTVFHVVENWEDVKDKVPADAPGRSFIDLNSGEIYINASKVRPHEVFEVMLHEVVGHKGLRNIFNDSQLDSLLDQVYSEHFNEEGFKEVARRYFDLTELTDEEGRTYFDINLENVSDQRLAAEEYIAYLAQQETKPSWWKEFLQKIRMFFARLPFFKDVRMTDDEINTVLARSARSVRRGMFDRRSRVETDGNGPETDEVRFSIIGERGAALLDRTLKQDNTANLQIAKEMLSAGKDAKTIKLATGWEKGGDGKWRMEVPDLSIKKFRIYGNMRETVEAPVLFDGPLEYYVDAPEIFSAYPQLRKTKLSMADLPWGAAAFYKTSNEIKFDKSFFLDSADKKELESARKTIEMSYNWTEEKERNAKLLGVKISPEQIRGEAQKIIDHITNKQISVYTTVLTHEVQHAIQEIEGFARGSSKEYFETHPVREEKLKKDYEEAIKEEYKRKKEAFDEHPELYEDFRRYEQIDKMGADEVTDENLEEMEEISDRLESAIGEKWTQYVDARRKLNNARFNYYRSEVLPYSAYIRTAGEVESRNAERRSRMTAEEKRNSLLSETEDVAEEMKIYLFDGDNGPERTGTDGNGRPYYDIPFADSVDAVMNNSYSGNGSVFMRDTPQIFMDMGFSKLPIMTTAKHIKSIYSSKQTDEDHNHDLGELIKQIPEKLENPLMVITSKTHPDTSVVVILELTDKNNNAVVVPIWLDGTSERGEINAHIMTSAQGRSNAFTELVKNAVDKENQGIPSILYAQKNAEPAANAEGVQFPNGFAFDSVNHNINDVGLKVKPQTKTLQFKKWFGKSKVVDQNGEPLVVYHGTDADFYSFDTKNGAWFSRSMEYAESMMEERNGKNLLACYLAIKNPMIVKADPQKFAADIAWEKSLIAEARTKGHDGLIIENNTDNDLEKDVFYVAFSPEQIKLAGNVDTNGELIPGTGNIGTFDPKNPDIRFSISEYSAEEVRDYVDILKPFTGAVIDRNPEDYAAYLKEHGVDIPEKDAFRFAQEAARQKMKQAKKAADARRDNWLYDNIMEYRWAVDFSGSFDFKIRVSPRFEKTEKSGTFWTKKNDSGKNIISLEELAKYVSRQTGKDELEVEENLFDFFRDLTKPILRKNYTDFKKEQFAADKEAAKQAFDEFMQQEKYRIQDEAVQVLSAGQPLTMDWIYGNRKVFNELYQMIFNKEAPVKVSQRDFEAINAALMQEGANASTYAEAYKVARANAWNEFQTKLTALRDNVIKQKADAVKLQREAVSFAEKELPKEARAEFVRDIIGLLEYSNAPSTKYPEGRRKAEFDKIIEKMTQRAGRERKESAISQIDSLLDQYKVMRTFKGIPISKVPSVQNVMTEVRRLTRMTAGAVNAYVGLQTALMSQAEDGSQAWEDARKRAELAAMFGNLQFKSADEAEEALKFLTKLVTEGKAEFRQQLRERLDKIKSMRNEVVRNLSGGVIDTTGKDADRFNKYLLKNRATLESFLRLIANTKIQDFDSTVLAQLVKEYEYAQEREKTQLRLFDQDFRKAVKDILGYDGLVGWKKFLDEINSLVTGVFRDVYTAKVEENGMSFPIIGKRPAIRTKVNWKIAEYALDKYADDVNMVFQKIGVSHARDIFKDYGEIKDDYAIFQVEEKFIVFSFDMENNSVAEFEVPSQAIDRRIFGGGRLVNDLSRRFVRKQTDDVSAGVKPVDSEFGNDAEDIQYQALSDLDKAAAEVEFLSNPRELKSSREEIPDLTINRAIQLILEWEQLDYKDAFEWNGFTAETIQQLYDAVPEKYKRLAYWMRDYVNQKSDKLDEVSVKKYGVHLPRIPNYWMGAFSGSAKQRLSADNMLGSMSMNPSFLIARKGHLKAPDTNADAVAMFISHVWQQAHFIENNDAVSDLAAVFNDSKVKTAINNTLGNNVTDEILRRIKEYAAGGGTEKKSFDILKKFLSFYAPAKVGFSIPSAAKQIAGMIAYAYNMPLKDYLKYSGRTVTLSGDFKEFARFAWNSDFVQNRFAGSLDKDLVYLMNHAINSEKYSVFSSFLLDVGTLPLRGADTVAVILGGYPVYAYTRDQALAAGKTPAEARKAAEYAWMKATNETQQSSNVTSKNYFMANYDGVLTLFRSNAIQTMDVVLRSLDEIKLGGKTKEAKQKLARRLLISHVIIPANMFLVSQLWSKGIDVEEWNWEDLFIGMLFGSWEGLFLAEYLKKATEKIVAIAAGKPFFSPSGSAVPVLDDSIDAINKIGKLFGDKELEPSDLAAGAKSLGDILMAGGIAYTPAGILGSVLSAAGTRARQVLRWFEDK